MKIWVKFVYCCFHLSKKHPPLRNLGYATDWQNAFLLFAEVFPIRGNPVFHIYPEVSTWYFKSTDVGAVIAT